MIKLFGHSLDERQHKLLDRIIEFLRHEASEILLKLDYEIIDLRSFDPEIKPQDTVIIFGERAQRSTQNMESRFRLKLPEPYDLDATLDENKINRELAFKELTQLKEAISSEANKDIPEQEHITDKTLNLTEKLPPKLTTITVKEIERQQREQDKIYWLGSTIDGKSIRVTIEPEQGTADINLTFAELFAVVGLKEAFRVKELEFVYKPSNPARKDNTE